MQEHEDSHLKAQPEPPSISIAIRLLRDELIANGEASSYYAINCGSCEDFALEVVRRMGALLMSYLTSAQKS